MLYPNLVPRVLFFPPSREEERGPWQRGCILITLRNHFKIVCQVIYRVFPSQRNLSGQGNFKFLNSQGKRNLSKVAEDFVNGRC